MEELFILIIIGVLISFLYSGGKNPIEYYENQKRKESERQRLRIARDSFIAEMKGLGSDLDFSKKSKNRSEWAVAKDFFLKSNEWKNIRQEVFKKYGRQCLKCGSRSRIEVDHILPVYDNPRLRLDFDNLQPLCHSCNSIKGTSTADYRKNKAAYTELPDMDGRSVRKHEEPQVILGDEHDRPFDEQSKKIDSKVDETTDEWLHFDEISEKGYKPRRQEKSTQIQRQTEEYLASGKKIKIIK